MAKKAIDKSELDTIVRVSDLHGIVIQELGNKFIVTNNGKLLTMGGEATFAGGTLKAMLQGYLFFHGLGESLPNSQAAE